MLDASLSISQAVIDAGFRLPRVIQKDTPFLLHRRTGNILHVSGMIAQFEGERPYLGRRLTESEPAISAPPS